MDEQGRVVIPAKYRKIMNLSAGDVVEVFLIDMTKVDNETREQVTQHELRIKKQQEFNNN